MKIDVKIDVPDELERNGIKYVPTGEARIATRDDVYYDPWDGKLTKVNSPTKFHVAIYEKKAWRAEITRKGECWKQESEYFCINYGFEDVIVQGNNCPAYGLKVTATKDAGMSVDNGRFRDGNYFRYRSDAENLVERIKDTIRDFRNEAGI